MLYDFNLQTVCAYGSYLYFYLISVAYFSYFVKFKFVGNVRTMISRQYFYSLYRLYIEQKLTICICVLLSYEAFCTYTIYH